MKVWKRSMAMLLLVAMTMTPLSACTGNGDDEPSEGKVEIAEILPQKTEYDSDYTVYPRAEGETQKTIYWIDARQFADYTSLFAALALQGLANRSDPSLYLVSDQIVQTAVPGFIASEFWLDALDESYVDDEGKPLFTKRQVTLEEAVLLYRDKIKNTVKYDARIVKKSVVANQYNDANICGEMAVLNLTSMMCGQYDALPVTDSLLVSLNDYLRANDSKELPADYDVRETVPGLDDYAVGDQTIWYSCYRYALDMAESGEWEFSEKALAHNGTFNAAWYDYVIQHKLFNFAEIGGAVSTITQEQADEILEDAFALTPANTPVMGVWHLNNVSEVNLVSYCNERGKFFKVTHESFNLSWSCGLPQVKAEVKEEKLTYDDSKVYIAFTYTEGDNNSYTHYKLPTPLHYGSSRRGSFAMTWCVSYEAVDINPNIIQYLNATMTEKDGWAVGECGIGYVAAQSIDEEYAPGFYGLNDLYAEKMGINGNIRLYRDNNVVHAMEYATYQDELDSMLIGYSPETVDYNNGRANFLYHGTPIFRNFFALSEPRALLDLNADGGSFFSFGINGWNGSMEDLYNIVSRLPDNYEVVTQSQLADLYRQKMKSRFENVNYANFETPMTEDEMGFLYTGSDLSSDKYVLPQDEIGVEGFRNGAQGDWLIYRFDLDKDARDITFSLNLSGECTVLASNDLKEWTELTKKEVESVSAMDVRQEVVASLPNRLTGRPVFLKIAAREDETVTRFRLYELTMTSDLSRAEGAIRFGTAFDSAYFVSGGKRNTTGARSGEVIYRLPAAADATRADITVRLENEQGTGDVSISVSKDGVNYSALQVNSFGRYRSAVTTSAGSGLYIKIQASESFDYVNFTPIRKIKSAWFSAGGCDTDDNAMTTGWDLARLSTGLGSRCNIDIPGDALTYVFGLDEQVTSPTLEISAGGRYRLEISHDGAVWQTLAEVSGVQTDPVSIYNIGNVAKPGGFFYLRFTRLGTGTPYVSYIRIK